MMTFSYLGVLCASCVLIDVVSGCRCLKPPPENEIICTADYAVIVKVLDDGNNVGRERVYKVTELRNLKSQSPSYSVIRDKIFTGTHSCGAFLRRGIYLLAGHHVTSDNGTIKRSVFLCGSAIRNLTDDEYKTYKQPLCEQINPT